jgi:stage VI sporulation protein D
VEQLRFNISEKIRLHPQQAGISSLLELDLYPDVEIKDEGQHLKIHGYLRLNGTYEGDLDEDADISEYDPDELIGEEIAYVIPVEITLPRNRAELAFVSAEVESFDYQLLSPFELQIEAVLMIDGILPEKDEEELITEVSDEDSEQEESPSFAAQPATPEQQIDAKEEVEEAVEEPTAKKEETPAPREIHRETRKVSKDIPDREPAETQLVIEEETIEAEEVAAGETTEEVVEEPENAAEEVRGRDWSSWLIGSNEDTFTAMKMVIVQRDESIDTLAAKYDISCDAILKTNHFSTDRLEEGQIVKIPVKRN